MPTTGHANDTDAGGAQLKRVASVRRNDSGKGIVQFFCFSVVD